MTVAHVAGILLLLLSCINAWTHAREFSGIDFYQFWVIGQAIEGSDVDNVYSDLDRRNIGDEFFQEATQAPSSEQHLRAAGQRRILETYSTPFLYAVMRLFVMTGNFDVDLQIYILLVILGTIGAVVALCRLLHYSFNETLLVLVLVTGWFEPFYSEVRVGNVNWLLLGLVVTYLWVQTWTARPRDLVGGFILGFGIVFKPVLVYVAGLLLLYWAFRRETRRLLHTTLGLAVAACVGFLYAGWVFGSLGCWGQWWTALRSMPSEVISFRLGNYAIARLIHEWSGAHPSFYMTAFFVALTTLALWAHQRSAGDGPGRPRSTGFSGEFLLVPLGCLLYLLTAPLAWLHYFMLALPMILVALRPTRSPHVRPAGQWLVLAAVLCCYMIRPLRALFGWTDSYLPAVGVSVGTLFLFGVGIVGLIGLRREREPSRGSSSPPSRDWFQHQLLPVGLITVLGILVFHNALPNAYHLDDFYRVKDNPGVEQLTPVGRHFVDPRTMSTLDRITQYRPLLPLTLSINYALHGDNLTGYHLGNLLLHLAAAVLVYFLCLELLRFWPSERTAGPLEAARPPGRPRPEPLALVVALLFTVHPVSGIVVNYISSRDLILMQLFLVGTLLVYARMRRLGESPSYWIAVLFFLVLSLLSKANAVVVPAAILLFEWILARQSVFARGLWLRVAPFALIVLAYFAATKWALGFSDFEQVVDRDTSAWHYLLTQLQAHLFTYLPQFFWPFKMRPMPAVELATSLWSLRVLAGLGFIVATIGWAWSKRRSEPLVAYGILMYWSLLIPTSSVLPFHSAIVDYRPYPSSPFFFLTLALIFHRLVSRRLLRQGAVCVATVVIVLLSIASYGLNTLWRTEESLWTHTVRHGGNAVAHLNLAMCIPDRSDPRVRENLETAARLNPSYILAHINLGLLLIQQGEPETGLEYCRNAVAMMPGRAQSHYWLAHAYTKLGRDEEAAEASARAADLDPRNIEYQYQAALDAQRVEDHAASLRYLQAVAEIDPQHESTMFLQGFAHQMLGQRSEAIEFYRRFLEQHPDASQASFNLAYALMKDGKLQEAVDYFFRTLELRPDYADVHLHLSSCYAGLGYLREAERHERLYEQATDGGSKQQ